jgi:mannose-6-phosphate isomerase-like protein (cupin superfamily)
MPMTERKAIVQNLSMVDRVIEFDDADDSARDAIRQAKLHYPIPGAHFIFANGGDRTQDNIPEMSEPNVEFAFGVGGENKMNSSSWILTEWKTPRTERAWGYYRVLHEVGANTKLKELTVMPKTCLSMQRHDSRAEFWFVAEGEATVYTLDNASTDQEIKCQLTVHDNTFIAVNEWHQLCNETNQPLKLIEIQYGDRCVEEDIERRT